MPHAELSVPLGRWIAEKGFHLVNGGGGGVMEATARGFQSFDGKTGMVLGVLPAASPCSTADERTHFETPTGYPNPYVDIPVRTHLHLSGRLGTEPFSRNHIVVLTADIVVALPGSEGTKSEIELCLEYKKPLVILNAGGAWNRYQNSGAIVVKTLDEVFPHLAK